VIRASGRGSIELAAKCFSRPAELNEAEGYRILHGFLLDPASGRRIDEVLVSVFRAPHSFTGEDGVEISCHGSQAVVRLALSALEAAGFAPALPGEFTFRAFLNGKTDLVGAEAVNELASAGSEAARAEALKRLSGTLSRKLARLRSSLVDLLAEIEASLDYPEDEGLDADISLPGRVGALSGELRALAAGFASGRLRQEGALVVVSGRPNAGKSSLFNLLLREERAIVSPEPGTTRDWLESWIELDGIALRLVDTAGLRDADSPVESAGVERSRDMARRADIVLYLVDGRAGLRAEDETFLETHPASLRLWNKIDLPDCLPVPPGWIGLSASNGSGLTELEAAARRALEAVASPSGATGATGAADEAEVLVASARQKRLLDLCVESLDAAAQSFAAGASLDSVAVHLREAAARLGEIAGDIAGEEVFERIFGSFCLGK